MTDHVEIFAEGSFAMGDLTWGWQCFRCREEEAGFGNATTAGEGRDSHICPLPSGVSRKRDTPAAETGDPS